MLTSVKNLIAKPLEHALRMYQRRDPKNQDIEPLLRALTESNFLSRRTGAAEHKELESWSTTSSSGLSSAIKHTIQSLQQWSMQPGINAMPASYTHRQMLVGVKLIGPKRVLHIILEDIRQQTAIGGAHIAYDVASALICAPDASREPQPPSLDAAGNMAPPAQRPPSLRDVLKTEAEECRKLQKKDSVLAEIVVRLHRRVEAHLELPQAQAMLQAADMSLALGGDTAALGDAMAAAAAAAGGVQGNGMAVDSVSLDMGMAGVSSDLGLGGSSTNGGGLDTTGDADLFGSLDNSMDVFDGWGDMDMDMN